MSFELVIFTFFSFYLLDDFVYQTMKILDIEAERGTITTHGDGSKVYQGQISRLTCLAQFLVLWCEHWEIILII